MQKTLKTESLQKDILAKAEDIYQKTIILENEMMEIINAKI